MRKSRVMSNQDLSDMVLTMSAEDMLVQVAPLIRKYSFWVIPGFDSDDLYQELSIIAWRCWGLYDRAKGSFINVLITAFTNRLSNIRDLSTRQVQSMQSYVCPKCGDTMPHLGRAFRPRCQKCSVLMGVVRSHKRLLSLDFKNEEDGSSFEIEDKDSTKYFDPDHPKHMGFWRSEDAEWRKHVTTSEAQIVEIVLNGREISESSTEILKGVYTMIRGLI